MSRGAWWSLCLIGGALALPLRAQDMARTMRTTLPDGGVATGDLQRTTDGIQASRATIVWEDGRTFTGVIFDSVPIRGTLRYPDGSSISGIVDDMNDSGDRLWLQGVSRLHTVGESTLGPPGTYRLSYNSRNRQESAAWAFGTPFQPDLSTSEPFDAMTLAKPTRNTKGCATPSVVPAGWIVWWPRCIPGPAGSSVTYNPDGTQKLMEGAPAGAEGMRMRLTRLDGKGFVADLLVDYGADSLQTNVGGSFVNYKTNFFEKTARPTSILAKAFTATASPSPVGVAQLHASDNVMLFKGTFDGQQPAIGRCRVPDSEGGGSEPCEFRSGQRIDSAHMLRQARIAALKREAEIGPQQAREASLRWKQRQDRLSEAEYERVRQQNRANAAVNEVDWGAVMNEVGDTFRRNAEEMDDIQQENYRRLEQARRADEAYRAQQQRTTQQQAAQKEAAQRLHQQPPVQQSIEHGRTSVPTLIIVNEALNDAPDTAGMTSSHLPQRTFERVEAFESAACRDLRGELMSRACFGSNEEVAACRSREHKRIESTRAQMVSMGCPATGSTNGGGVRADP